MGSVLVAGAGSWGSALAILLARNGSKVLLWGHRPEHIARLQSERMNSRYLPGAIFPELLTPIEDLAAGLATTGDVIIAVPFGGLRALLETIGEHRHESLRVCCASKGFESDTQRLSHDVVMDVLGTSCPHAALSGPTFAAEVVAGQPSAAVIAASQQAFANDLVGLFHGETFRAYSSDDLVGVGVGGAVKNVLAIAAGVASGLGFKANTLAVLITRGLAEMTRLGVALGGRFETFTGLAGLGDLLLTCSDDQSRNRRLGLALADGKTLSEAQRDIGQVVEGVRTAAEVTAAARRLNIEMPIAAQVERLLNNQCTPLTAVQTLLAREPKQESRN